MAYIDREAFKRKLIDEKSFFPAIVARALEEMPAADVVEVKTVSEKIIRKKAEVNDYWQNDVKKYLAMQGYSDIEHDTDNFLRGYNEAVEDFLAILDGRSDTNENSKS